MTNRISRTVVVVSLVSLVLSLILVNVVFYNSMLDSKFKNQKLNLSILENSFNVLGLEHIKSLELKGTRITILDKESNVIYDNKYDSKKMENHADRPEIKSALSIGYGKAIRHSKTLGEGTIYSAKKTKNNKIIRISTSVQTLSAILFKMLGSIILIAVFVFAIALFMAKKLSKRIIVPINSIDPENPLENNIYDELNPLVNKIEEQNRKIKEQISSLMKKTNEINYISKNIKDGIVLIDDLGKIVSINDKARFVLGGEEGDYYLDFCRDLAYKNSVSAALKGKSSTIVLEKENSSYKLHISPSEINTKEYAVFIFVYDMNTDDLNQLIRREFSANVSHELKTPLAAILASSEIIENGLAKGDDARRFAAKINLESKRLLVLIENIIKLSKLDEYREVLHEEEISMKDLLVELAEQLKFKARQKNIKIKIKESDLKIKTNYSILYEIIYNLVDNAIKYGRQNGWVELDAKKTEKQIEITVTDNAVGISEKDIDHIFERFYRVDKSHSRESGGSGLGLSIAKNSASQLGFEIFCNSELKKGSKFTIAKPLF